MGRGGGVEGRDKSSIHVMVSQVIIQRGIVCEYVMLQGVCTGCVCDVCMYVCMCVCVCVCV